MERACCYDDCTTNTKQRLINRTKRVEGQIRGIIKMLDNNVYCDDIITQVTAARNALNAVAMELFELHLRSCIKQQLGEYNPEIMEELNETASKMMRY